MKNLLEEEMRLNVNDNSENFDLIYPFDNNTSIMESI